MQLKLSMGQLNAELKKFSKQSPVAFDKAMAKGGIQLLSWATNGTGKSSSKPQIDTGFLRGSGSVFVGGKLIQVAEGFDNSEANTSGTDNNKRHNLSIGYNAVYAHRRHEEIHAITQKDGDAKWLEEHLKMDKDELYKFIAVVFKKDMGM